MSIRKDSIKQRVKSTAEKLQIFTRPQLYAKIQNLKGKNIPEQTMKREFTYLLQMGYIEATKEMRDKYKIYKYTKGVSAIKNFFYPKEKT